MSNAAVKLLKNRLGNVEVMIESWQEHLGGLEEQVAGARKDLEARTEERAQLLIALAQLESHDLAEAQEQRVNAARYDHLDSGGFDREEAAWEREEQVTGRNFYGE